MNCHKGTVFSAAQLTGTNCTLIDDTGVVQSQVRVLIGEVHLFHPINSKLRRFASRELS